ncbi:hypothetical protein BSKO_07552 [Bryopsis sp. KO-2023]|nr:hypothetical protein BSKO_07552 [Bryopsis sp. KO-2023]
MSSEKRPRLETGIPSSHDDQELLKALEEMDDCQDDLDKVNDEASDKVMKIQQEYNKIREPLYVKRNAIIRKIPEFWKTALHNHPTFRDVITEDDESALFYLTEVLVEDAEDMKSGFKIVFKFGPNPFFKDRELLKTVAFSEEGTVTVDGTPPQWLEGMGPNDKPSAGGHKRSRPNTYSFLQWFAEAGVMENGHQDEVAAIIRDEIWPNPLKYYQEDEDDDYDVSYPADGQVDQEEYDDEDFDEDDDDDDDDGSRLSPTSKPKEQSSKDL